VAFSIAGIQTKLETNEENSELTAFQEKYSLYLESNLMAKEISPIVSFLVKDMGNRLHSDETTDSIFALVGLFDLLKKDQYPKRQ
jgi:hypothetical protein